MNQDINSITGQNKVVNQENPNANEPLKVNLLTDILAFSWIPLRSSLDTLEAYKSMGMRGSVSRIMALAILNSTFAVVCLVWLIGGNPYIDLAYDLEYLPFIFMLGFLLSINSLMHTVAHFLCFRAISGKGDLISHGYLEVISSSNVLLLMGFALGALYTTHVRGLDTIIMIVGGLYMLLPSFVSLRAIHRISIGRTIIGIILCGIVSAPLLILYFYLFARFREAIPYEIYDWRLLMHFDGLLLFMLFVLAYMIQQKGLTAKYPNGTPLLEPIKIMVKQKWVQLVIAMALFILIASLALDLRYASFNTQLPPYSIAILPKVAPNTLFVYTKTTDNERDYSQSAIELWDIETREELASIAVPYGFLLRPNEEEDKLIISHHWSANVVFNPINREVEGTTEFLGGTNPYNPTYNPARNEYYGLKGKHHTGYHSLVVYTESGEKAKLDYYALRGEIWAVTVHPDGKSLFIVGDHFVDILDAATLDLIDSIYLGGKLRDVAVSSDGKFLYVTDAVWRRVRIIPLPPI